MPCLPHMRQLARGCPDRVLRSSPFSRPAHDRVGLAHFGGHAPKTAVLASARMGSASCTGEFRPLAMRTPRRRAFRGCSDPPASTMNLLPAAEDDVAEVVDTSAPGRRGQNRRQGPEQLAEPYDRTTSKSIYESASRRGSRAPIDFLSRWGLTYEYWLWSSATCLLAASKEPHVRGNRFDAVARQAPNCRFFYFRNCGLSG
jgi:hypothetical protein